MPGSSSKGIYTNHAQLNRKFHEVKTLAKHREELLKDIIKFINEQKATDLIITSD